MKTQTLTIYLFLALWALPHVSIAANGTLTENITLFSNQLNYKLQYRVYIPNTTSPKDNLPVIYFTDGQWYLKHGKIIEVLNKEIASEQITPVIAVFIDSRNPDDLSENRRNKEFMCNQQYIHFYLNELIPAINSQYPVNKNPINRVIAGISFGGLNAACFGLLASEYFSGIAMQSPASGKHLKVINKLYKENVKRKVDIFFSIGTKNDNTKEARQFHRTLKRKGYKVNYIEVPFGHEWANWKPLMDNMLRTFFNKTPNSTN